MFQMIFEGEIGAGSEGDIALDDISFFPSACGGKYHILLKIKKIKIKLRVIVKVFYLCGWTL